MRPMTFDEIVSDYIRNYRDAAREEMGTFRRERNCAAAIRRAALCKLRDGKRHPHQCLIPKRLLELAEERLQATAKHLADARDFDALHDIVKRKIGSVHGIGKLTVYDIAHRIGAYFGKSPRLIYLHRGTKEGAAILGFKGEMLDPALLPAAFSGLTAPEAEDCLCIYKNRLREVTDYKRSSSGRGVATRQRGCR
jgi:hypothetical protein